MVNIYIFSFYLEGRENNQKEEIRMLSTWFLNFTLVSDEFHVCCLLNIFFNLKCKKYDPKIKNNNVNTIL